MRKWGLFALLVPGFVKGFRDTQTFRMKPPYGLSSTRKFPQSEKAAAPERDGDWVTESWFLHDKHDEYFSRWGFSRADREHAASALARVFPPSVCQGLLQRPWYGGVIAGLFFPEIPHLVVPLLRLGLDLSIAAPWSDAALLNRLRNREHFDGAALEVATWAALQKFNVERVLESGRKKQHDFRVTLGRRLYSLELKALGPSEGEYVGRQIDEAFWSLADVLVHPQRELRALPSNAYESEFSSTSGRARLLQSLPEILSDFRSAALLAIRKGLEPGNYQAGRWGTLLVESSDAESLGSFECRLGWRESDERQAQRVLDAIVDAAKQLPRSGMGIALVEPYATGWRRHIRQALTRAWQAMPAKFRNCHLAFIRGSAEFPDGSVRPFLFPLSVDPSRGLSRYEISLARALTFPSRRVHLALALPSNGLMPSEGVILSNDGASDFIWE